MILRHLLLFLLAGSLCCEGAPLDLGRPVKSTEYDSYLQPVGEVSRKPGKPSPTMEQTTGFMKTAHSFFYEHDAPYVPATPTVTEQRHAGDCKDKALWLLNAMGDHSARFVIGKCQQGDKQSHAWLVWPREGQWWILDPTIHTAPVSATSCGRTRYIPLYSYQGDARFRHAAANGAGHVGQVAVR